MRRLRWLKRAREDVRAIGAYLRDDEQSPQVAEDMVRMLLEAPDRLMITENPKIGKIVPEHGREDIRQIWVHKYGIIYRVTDDQIRILMVWHGKRRPPSLKALLRASAEE